jgi:hypothetical protein
LIRICGGPGKGERGGQGETGDKQAVHGELFILRIHAGKAGEHPQKRGRFQGSIGPGADDGQSDQTIVPPIINLADTRSADKPSASAAPCQPPRFRGWKQFFESPNVELWFAEPPQLS